MKPTITALKIDGKEMDTIYIAVSRTKKKQPQIHLGLKTCSLFLRKDDAFELCNRIIDELEK